MRIGIRYIYYCCHPQYLDIHYVKFTFSLIFHCITLGIKGLKHCHGKHLLNVFAHNVGFVGRHDIHCPFIKHISGNVIAILQAWRYKIFMYLSLEGTKSE